ncbi:MAG: hypothetical protein SFT92_01975 [Rickettsiales bacterium]|nr:hypothetical protein [Rickettsiales bacterium]
MQNLAQFLNFFFLPVASNDNEDLLALRSPSCDLALIRELRDELLAQNALNGILLRSRKERRFFQEISDAERYILLRYFTPNAPQQVIEELKRHILNNYLIPRRRKKKETAE